jgi:ABC-2 type transport system permease protein
MMEQLVRARYITWKDLRTYYLKPPLISWGILFPGSMILAFYLRNPGDFRAVVPGLIGLTLLFGATSMEAIVIAFEKRVGSLDRLAMAPFSPGAIILAKVASGVVFALLTGTVVWIGAILFTDIGIGPIWWIIPTFVLSATAFAFLGVFVSVVMKEVFEAMTLANYFRLPMTFLCGVFFPVASMPGALQGVAMFLPLTYCVDALRLLLLGGEGSQWSWPVDWLALLLFSVALYPISARLLAKRLETAA